MNDLTYYYVEPFDGMIEKSQAESDLDLDVTLANGNCFKTLAEAETYSQRIISQLT